MKKWKVTGVLACCIFTLFLVGCATDPDVLPADTEQVQPDETVVVDIPETSDLTEKNAALIAEGTAARELAIVAGAERYFPDELLVIDIAASEAQAVYDEGGDPEAFNETASDVVYQYRALEQASLANTAQKRIDELGFENYNPEQYAIGMEATLEIERLFNSGAPGADLYAQAKKSADAYMLVLQAGFLALAEIERDAFLEVKEKADAIKANVADKEGYANAVLFFTQASAHLLAEAHEDAYNNFAISNTSITEVHETVSMKRAAAEEAIARAKRRTAEANDVAVKADTLVPLADVEALDSLETDDAVQEDE